jgi:transcription antitermination factor NusG
MTWYVAITNPNCHRRAEAGLSALGYQSFWPKLRKWVSHARTKVAKEYPILGRYLFVEIPDGAFWNVRNVHGIEAFVVDGSGVPAQIPAPVVWEFRQRYLRGEWDFVGDTAMVDEDGHPRRNLIPHGALIRIMEGEFAECADCCAWPEERQGKVSADSRT